LSYPPFQIAKKSLTY